MLSSDIYFFCRCVDVAYRNIFFFCRCGDVTTLNVHALVHSTNEKLNDKSPETEKMYDKAGNPISPFGSTNNSYVIPNKTQLNYFIHS
jgi:hypothetical protein